MQLSKPVILTMLLALTACASEDEADKKSDGDGMIEQAVEAQQVPLQKAKDLEQQLQEDFEKQQKEIDEQSGGDDG